MEGLPAQILEIVDLGVVVLDTEFRVCYWNRWMAFHSGIAAEAITGTPIFESYPKLNTPEFLRGARMSLTFGSPAVFPQSLHHYLFPFKVVGTPNGMFDLMQQHCTSAPLREPDGEIGHLLITVQDVTERAISQQRLRELNIRDQLTGAYNRRYLDHRLPDECKRHDRHHRSLSVIMIDIDFFKKVNDQHGHEAGDKVLSQVAGKLMATVRKTDCLVRYGGEEFCCILPETPLENACVLADRFRTSVERLAIAAGSTELRVTISLGVAQLRPEDTHATLLKRADEGLYDAKQSGRNRVIART
ncbi:GGDEF domain-containing protein [Geomonas sp. Red32]|uniref:GGDEF domain-containing protein n=1 Tax=Geomonas sp. Red32 TaxID=2912856 RepID=UPI00202CBC31|nr:sensor domain-containing diguanylate cyclase [Geomonas sp. Red32]MCM0083501.1 GGDEF domain-containing protein [Geomonas sp. Red32]